MDIVDEAVVLCVQCLSSFLAVSRFPKAAVGIPPQTGGGTESW